MQTKVLETRKAGVNVRRALPGWRSSRASASRRGSIRGLMAHQPPSSRRTRRG